MESYWYSSTFQKHENSLRKFNQEMEIFRPESMFKVFLEEND